MCSAVQHVERREQRHATVAGVVVGLRGGFALGQRQHDGRRIASQSRKPLSPPGRIRLWCWPTGPTPPLGRFEEKGLITFDREGGIVQLAPEPQNISPPLAEVKLVGCCSSRKRIGHGASFAKRYYMHRTVTPFTVH